MHGEGEGDWCGGGRQSSDPSRHIVRTGRLDIHSARARVIGVRVPDRERDTRATPSSIDPTVVADEDDDHSTEGGAGGALDEELRT